MTNESTSENSIARLHYASARSGKRRALHTNKKCPDLQQSSGIKSAPITNLPRGSLCDRCEPDKTLADLREEELDDSDEDDLPDGCPDCGYASTSGSTERTPQGRPTCPECGVIPDGYELASRQEVPADD